MVEQSAAASHALAQETEELARLTSRFQLGESANDTPKGVKPAKAGRPTPETTPRPALRTKASASPVKLVSRGGANAVRQAEPVANADPDGWTEF